ncbi:hypothetical protein BOTCAL_0929g00030 [Botryotinia calthae]|uniref:Uncharacterized protein n=1 Tax=Botryotinia calthae TaxID=38488 RepID=A0A4Y8CF76_9HELO|nr:hypothetical protein BOTCAL_0929g00030 [Botryotinia calthae]
MKTQRFSTPSPNSSPKTAPNNSMSRNSTPSTPPNTRILSPPRAPRQRRFLRPEVTPRTSESFRTPYKSGDRLNSELHSPRPSRRNDRRNAHSRSPPRNRARAYRSRSPPRNHLFGKRSGEVLLGPLLPNAVYQSTGVYNNLQSSGSYDMNERFKRMLSLAETEHKEKASENKSSRISSNKTIEKKSKEIDSGNFENSSKTSSDKEHRFWS